MSTYSPSSAYAGGSILSQVLSGITTASTEVRNWVQLTGQQRLERARLDADTTVKLAAIRAGGTVSVPALGGGNVLGQVGAWLPWLVLIFGGLAAVKAFR